MKTREDWKEDFTTRLLYLDIPKKYYKGLIDFVEKLIAGGKEPVFIKYMKTLEEVGKRIDKELTFASEEQHSERAKGYRDAIKDVRSLLIKIMKEKHG